MEKTALKNREKLELIYSLATLLKSGIPIIDAVTTLEAESKGNLKKILKTLSEDLNQGKKVSYTFAKFPKAFDPISVNLVKAAEEAGTLDETLKDLTENIKKDIDLEDKVKAALTYPILVLIVFTFVMLLILTFVIPRVATVFSRLKVTLPLPTKILMAVSNLILSYKIPIAIGALVVIIVLVLLFRAKKDLLYRLSTSLPVLKKLAITLDLTRFTRTMYLLLASGIPISDALDLAKNVISKQELLKIVEQSKNNITSGKKISLELKKSPKFIPSIMIRVIESAEKSGTLEQGMSDLSEHFENKVSENLKTATTLLEPIMLIIIAILIGGMMLAIIAPIYGLISQVGAR